MRIVLRALAMMAGLLLLGMFVLALCVQVLDAAPTKTDPPTAEDMAELRATLSVSAAPVAASNEPTTICTTATAPVPAADIAAGRAAERPPPANAP